MTALWLGSIVNQAIAQSLNNTDYWAAKYSRKIDFSGLKSMLPEVPAAIKSDVYYMQYGDELVIELKDPGDEVGILPIVITKWDYRNGIATIEMIFSNVKKYYIVTDSIPFSIEESRNNVKYICDTSAIASNCDSVIVTATSSNIQYLVALDYRLSNMRSYSLFYPDVKSLPKVIERQGMGMRWSPLVLDQLLFGKHAIDSLLNKFEHEGYEQITVEEMHSFELHVPIETLQEIDRIGRTKEVSPP